MAWMSNDISLFSLAVIVYPLVKRLPLITLSLAFMLSHCGYVISIRLIDAEWRIYVSLS